jgi:hypothetical protein
MHGIGDGIRVLECLGLDAEGFRWCRVGGC